MREENVKGLLNRLVARESTKEKWHIVTGSASGLGAETVKQLLNRGYKVIGIDVTSITQSGATQDFLQSPRFRFIEGDLSKDGFVQEVKEFLSKTDFAGIFSVAGIGPRSAVSTDSPLSVRRVFDLNFFLPIELHRLMLESHLTRSYFCFVGSSSGVTGLPMFSAYSASKSALSTYFFAAMCEESKSKIDTLGVIPSGMKTNFQKNKGVPSSPLDKVLLADSSKIASNMVSWMESSKRKSKIEYYGISAGIFLAIRNLPYRLQRRVVKTLTEGTR